VKTVKNKIDTKNDDFLELKKHYVYELVNSIDNKVFYVGKGQGERAHQHIKEASSEGIEETEKIHKIKTIKNNGGKTIVRVIGRYRTGTEAFSVESTLIHWVYGKENLTNNQPGHGSDSIREKDDLGEIPNIDIPEKIRSFDGAYSRKHEAERDKHNIIPFMTELKSFLESKTGLSLSDVDHSNSRFTTLRYDYGNICIQLSKTSSSNNQVWIGLVARSGKEKDRNYIENISRCSDFISQNHGQYAKHPEYNKFSNFEEILDAFGIIINQVDKAISILPCNLYIHNILGNRHGF